MVALWRDPTYNGVLKTYLCKCTPPAPCHISLGSLSVPPTHSPHPVNFHQLIITQRHYDNFGNFQRQLAFAQAAIFLYNPNDSAHFQLFSMLHRYKYLFVLCSLPVTLPYFQMILTFSCLNKLLGPPYAAVLQFGGQ
jgi:hypothetical protein